MKHSGKMIVGALLGLLAGGAALVSAGVKASSSLETNYIQIREPELPEAFDGLKIVLLSDLHGNTVPGLEKAIAYFNPDLIACVGDIFDGVRHAGQTEAFLQQLKVIAPVFFVSGNHEYYSGSWPQRSQALEENGIHVLDNRCITLERDGQVLELCGLADPDLNARWTYNQRLEQFKANMNTLPAKQAFRILLSHRADLFEESKPIQANLTLSGHLHGGHWRLADKGILAPNNGSGNHLFPKYNAGLYEAENRKLYVSRGLGDQMALPRLFNPPELALITLTCQ